MSIEDDNAPTEPAPNKVEAKTEEVEEWRDLISQLRSEMTTLADKIENKQGASPELQALTDQVNRLASQLETAESKLATAETELVALRLRTASPRNEGEGNLTQETPKEGSLDQMEQPAPKPQTKAARLGWI